MKPALQINKTILLPLSLYLSISIGNLMPSQIKGRDVYFGKQSLISQLPRRLPMAALQWSNIIQHIALELAYCLDTSKDLLRTIRTLEKNGKIEKYWLTSKAGMLIASQFL